MKKILTRKTLLSITSLVSVFFLLTACQSDKKELSEKVMRTRTLEILNEIILVETEPESVELYYENNQKSIDSLQGQKGGTIIPEYKATWRADCSFAEGDDYQIVFNAVTA